MKRSIFTLILILTILSSYAQDGFEHLKRTPGCFLPPEADSAFWWSERGGLRDPEGEHAPKKPAAVQLPGMPVIHLPPSLTLHFLSPEPIQYVDISTKSIEGDLPLKNLLRIRVKENASWNDAVVTIAGETFIAQYHLLPGGTAVPPIIEIQPGDIRPADISGAALSQPQLKKLAYQAFTCTPRKPVETAKAFGIKASLNHVYTAGDYIFLDVTYKNRTNLSFGIEALTFKLDDKKIAKATNVQSLEIKPEFSLFNTPSFDRYYRNVFIFKKLTYPSNKVLDIELSEKQISGRVITLGVSYKDVLEADTIPM